MCSQPGYQGYIEVSVEDGYEPVGRPIEETAAAATQLVRGFLHIFILS